MSRFQPNIICQTKNQDLNLNEKRQVTDTNTKMTGTLELSDKEFKDPSMNNYKPIWSK